MPQILIKPNPNEDFYIYWSTDAEMPLLWGTQERITEEMVRDAQERAKKEVTAYLHKAIPRASTFGSSTPQYSVWNRSRWIRVHGNRRILKVNIPRYVKLLEAERNTEADALLEPWARD
jgi:hypothetical protein